MIRSSYSEKPAKNHCIVRPLFIILISSTYQLSAHRAISFDEEFISRKSFVDKSELLVEFFRDVGHDFLTMPAFFGKTTNLKMIEKFAQYQWNVKGDPIGWKDTHAYQIFQHLSISKHVDVISKHLGQHPVISFDLNMENAGLGVFENLLSQMNSQLSHCFLEHQHKFETYYSSPNVQSTVKDWVLQTLSLGMCRQDLVTNLQNTVEAMNECFDANVILLVDGFDDFMYRNSNPVEKTFVMFKVLNTMFRNVIESSASGNVHVFITSATSMVFDYFQMYRFLRLHRFLEGHKYTPYFGLDRAELDQVFDRYGSNETERSHVLKYMDGYRINDREYFSPYSISEFYHKRTFSKPRVPYNAFVRPKNPCKFIWKFLKHPKYLSAVAKVLKHCPVKDVVKNRYDPGAFTSYIDYLSRDFNCSQWSDANLLFTLSIEHGIFAPVAENTYSVANYLMYTLLVRHLRLHYKLFFRIDIVKIGSYMNDILCSTSSSELEAKTNLQNYLGEAMAKLEELHEDDVSMEFVYHSVLHAATYTNKSLFIIEEYPTPVSHEVTDEVASRRRVSLIRNRETDTALLIKITRRKSAEVALEQASLYVYHDAGVNVVKYVGIDVGLRGVVSMLIGYVEGLKEDTMKKYAVAAGR